MRAYTPVSAVEYLFLRPFCVATYTRIRVRVHAGGVKEAVRLDLNRIKAKEWTPRRFPITLEFT